MNVISFSVTTLWIALLALNPPLYAKPLTQADNESVYQRVLTRPGCQLYAKPEKKNAKTKPPTFTVFYVFARKTVNGVNWLQVGPNAATPPTGWMLASKTIDWKQTLVLTFQNPANRLPALFFDSRDALRKVVDAPNASTIAKDLVTQARRGKSAKGVISIEPKEHVDLKQQFYLIPILQAKEVDIVDPKRGVFRTKMVEVASVPLAPPNEPEHNDRNKFQVGLVFVIDTTLSMDPYIKRTRQAMERIFQRIKKSPIAKQVSFAMVGFRDNTDAAGNLGYVSKVHSPLRFPPQTKTFLKEIKAVKAATASSKGFEEDGLAGVMDALNMKAWAHFDGRYIIFISDAGLREPPDPLAKTGYTIEQVNAQARNKHTAVISLHLQTPAGKNSRQKTEQQMRTLAKWTDGTELFYSVPEGSLVDFAPTIDALTDDIIGQVQAGANKKKQNRPQQPQARAALRQSVSQVGHAMRLAWLGKKKNTAAPDVIRGWTVDSTLNDLGNSNKALQIRVLLTRNQLSDLYSALKIVRDVSNQTLDKPYLFFDQLQTVLAKVANDPSQLQALDPTAAAKIKAKQVDNLGKLMGDYLSHLPYHSTLMQMDRDSWKALSKQEQHQQLVSIDGLLRVYEHFGRDSDLWVALHPQASPGEMVYPVPLEFLP